MTSVLILLSGFDPGTYVIEDNGVPGDGIAQLRTPEGSAILFNIPTEFLSVTASAGRSVVFNLTESFGTANINVGNLAAPGENPDNVRITAMQTSGNVTIAANGSIAELGSDAAADIVAGQTILSAQGGVGTAGNALELRTGVLEAETDTGGINLSNEGSVVIGGVTEDVAGLSVTTSGNIVLTAQGTITLADGTGTASVRGGAASGDVRLVANGYNSDITSIVDLDAISALRGSVVLTAGRDISLGTAGANFDNDVRANRDLTITAGRDLNLDGFSDVAADAAGLNTGGNLVVNAGRDINLLNSTGADASLGAEGTAGGDVTLRTGQNGFLRVLAATSSALFSNSGDVAVFADHVLIAAESGIWANTGRVFIRTRSVGWEIDLGSVTDGGFALELSNTELGRITAPALYIGDARTGQLAVTSALSLAAPMDMILASGGDVAISAAMSIAGDLTASAGNNLFVTAAGGLTAASVTLGVDSPDTDAGTGAFGFLGGLPGSSPYGLNGGADSDTLTGSSSADRLAGGGGADSLTGAGGSDTLVGGAGADTMAGGIGDDTYVNPVPGGGDSIVENPGEGLDTVISNASISLNAVANVEALILSGSANLDGTGNAEANTITGNSGANLLTGGSGADTLNGGAGNDTLVGGKGADSMNGGPGADVFRFAASGTGGDTINGFATAADRFDLSGGAFTAVAEIGANTRLTHAGGSITVTGVTGLTLGQWNALVLPSGGRVDAAPLLFESGALESHAAADMAQAFRTHFAHAEWLWS